MRLLYIAIYKNRKMICTKMRLLKGVFIDQRLRYILNEVIRR